MPAPRKFRSGEAEIFIQWLKDRGADVLAPMSQWEVIRFVANGETSVIYQRKDGRLTWTGQGGAAWGAFKGRRQWMPGKRVKRKGRKQHIEALVARDGQTCWYCGFLLEWEEMTVEHMVSLSSGGPNHLDNLVIACEPCNQEAHTKSVSEKPFHIFRNYPLDANAFDMTGLRGTSALASVDLFHSPDFHGRTPIQLRGQCLAVPLWLDPLEYWPWLG